MKIQYTKTNTNKASITPPPQLKPASSKAFTLAEVLTTLMVIGVVAALTIPNLVQSYKERAAITKIKQVHSLLNQAYKMAVIDHGEFDTWEKQGKYYMWPMKPYLNVIKDCTGKKNCVPSNYTDLAGVVRGIPCDKGDFNASGCVHDRYYLKNGMIFYGLSGLDRETRWYIVGIDIDGEKGLNKTGHDLFFFKIRPTIGVLPHGNKEKINDANGGCQYQTGGESCTLWVLEKGNMDYLRKRVEW